MRGTARPDLTTLGVLAALVVATGCGRVGYEVSEDRSGTSDSGGAPPIDASTSGGTRTGGAGGGDGPDASNGAAGVENGGAPGGGGTSGVDAGRGGTPASSGGADGGSDGGTTSTGGTTGSGGATSTGGTTSAGGTTSTGGTTASGGTTSGAGCTGASYGGHAYVFCSSTLSFADAAADCVARSMRLARIDDAGENTFVVTQAFAAYAANYNPSGIWPWFGAYDVASPVEWRFMDGTVFWTGKNNGTAVGGLYNNWGSANPGDATGTWCAVVTNATTHIWVDRACTELRSYVCEAY